MSSKPVDPRKRALQMNAGSQISNILHPIKAPPPKGTKVVNHSANNRQALKAAQVRNQLRREEEEAKAAEAPFKMARFKAVESVLRQKSHDGTLGRPLAPGERASASSHSSRRTASGGAMAGGMGGLSAKMGAMSMGRGGSAGAHGQYEDEEENIYDDAAPHRGGQHRASHYDDGGDDEGQEWRGEHEAAGGCDSYEDGGRFDDEAEQEYSRQQHHPAQGQGRGRQQQQSHYDEDDESINTLMNSNSRQQQQQQQQYGAAPASSAPRGISSLHQRSNSNSQNSMRPPASLQGGYDRDAGQRSFIQENAKRVIQTSRAMASSRGGGGGGDDAASEYGGSSSGAGAGANIQKHDNYGRVPQYIRDQQAAMAQAKAAAEAAKKEKDLGIPPGMVLMPEEQRLNTLAVLQENHKKVLYDISCFPLRVETISRKKAKAELEAKLEEIEKALQLFSRKRVLIQP